MMLRCSCPPGTQVHTLLGLLAPHIPHIEIVVRFTPVANQLANLHQEDLVFIRGPTHNGIPEEGGISYMIRGHVSHVINDNQSVRGSKYLPCRSPSTVGQTGPLLPVSCLRAMRRTGPRKVDNKVRVSISWGARDHMFKTHLEG